MEEDDAETRKDLFALKDSRLYHHHHHHDRKDKGSNSMDGGYDSRGDGSEQKKTGKVHDPSEL